MIPFLGINLTKNPNNEQTNGNEFLIKKTPAKLTAEIQNQTAKLNDMAQKSQTSPVFSFIQYSTVTIFTITTLIISKKPGNTGISRDIRTEFTTDLLLSD